MPKGYKKIFNLSERINYEGLEFDYLMNDFMSDDDERFRLIEAIRTLNPVELKIFLAYTEIGTYTATAKEFGVNPATVKTYINKCRNKILNAYAS